MEYYIYPWDEGKSSSGRSSSGSGTEAMAKSVLNTAIKRNPTAMAASVVANKVAKKVEKVAKKVVRLIELAKEFEKSEKDIFGEEDIYGGNINTLAISTFNPSIGSVVWEEMTTKGVSYTRGQLIESKAKLSNYNRN